MFPLRFMERDIYIEIDEVLLQPSLEQNKNSSKGSPPSASCQGQAAMPSCGTLTETVRRTEKSSPFSFFFPVFLSFPFSEICSSG